MREVGKEQNKVPPSLTQVTLRNIGFVYVALLVSKLLNLVAIVILARLLLPFDFGVVALSSVVIAFLTLFKDFGLGAALIQRTSDIPEALNITFWGNIILRLLLYVIAFILAPVVSIFFQEPLLTPIMRVASLTFVVEALGSCHSAYLMKELQFKKIVLVTTTVAVVIAVSTILFAFLGLSYWSLVLGALIGEPIGVVLYWALCPWRPKVSFNRKVAKEMLGYGTHIVAINSLGFGVHNIDNFTIGKILGAISLGIYTLAYRIGMYSATNITILVSRVLFPTYSKIQGEPERIRRAYLKTLSPIALLSIPISLGTIVLAPELVGFLLGSKWLDTIMPLRILAIYGLFYSVAGPGSNVFLAVGKPQISTKIVAMELGIIGILVYPLAVWFQVIGVAIAATISISIGGTFSLSCASKVLEIPGTQLWKLLREPLMAGLLMLVTLIVARSFLGPSFLIFVSLICLGVGVYSFALYLLTKGGVLLQVREIIAAARGK